MKILALTALLPIAVSAQTSVSISNFTGTTQGFPIVDNTGVPIASGDLSVQFGTFANDFIDALPALSTMTDDAQVTAAFTPTGVFEATPSNVPGLFNLQGSGLDAGNSLLGQDIFVLVAGPDDQVIVFETGAVFPEQDVTGAASLPSIAFSPDELVFGDAFVGVNTESLEAVNAGFGEGFETGIAFEAVPEPSTSLLAGLAALGLVARRRR